MDILGRGGKYPAATIDRGVDFGVIATFQHSHVAVFCRARNRTDGLGILLVNDLGSTAFPSTLTELSGPQYLSSANTFVPLTTPGTRITNRPTSQALGTFEIAHLLSAHPLVVGTNVEDLQCDRATSRIATGPWLVLSPAYGTPLSDSGRWCLEIGDFEPPVKHRRYSHWRSKSPRPSTKPCSREQRLFSA